MSYRVIVCGGRGWGVASGIDHPPVYAQRVARAESERTQLNYVLTVFHDAFGIKELGHGAARGADSLAGEWAKAFGVPCQTFPADWKAFGNSAGIIRNREMLERFAPDFVIAFPGGAGTEHCIDFAKRRGIAVLRANAPGQITLTETA